jgi:hypothetical protein
MKRGVDQHLGEVGVKAPVAGFVRVGQHRAPNRFAEPHVRKLRGLGRQAGFDVSETFPIGQLGKRHNPEMFGAAQRLDVTVATIPLDNPRKCRPRQKSISWANRVLPVYIGLSGNISPEK